MPESAQQVLPFGPVHNVGLFSSHWLEHRLELEPEWRELREAVGEVLERLGELWQVERNWVGHYGDEQGLEVGFLMLHERFLGVGDHLRDSLLVLAVKFHGFLDRR